ncbi:efflux transporter outer membrane subunit [Aurantiacibacter spongiae]|uniref:Efflux transporter outer membrane subunit n=1 Tax=Aurantiacibacter spongiae TaxID=2488860 RepID=A0A3N5CU52_9SPHN|nr:efflux transporter outer membrane subunit [Aurantiacibacter spongiae]
MLAGAGSLALAACTVGPDYAGPPSVASATGENTAFVRAGPGLEDAAPQLAAWWESLDDPALNELEEQALAANPDLAVARARVAEARGALAGIDAEAYPSASAIATAAHIRVPGLGLGSNGSSAGEGGSGDGATANGTTSTNFFNLGLNASWQIDLFGGYQRQAEAARADLAAGDASLADAQVALTASVADAYVDLRAAGERLGLAEDAVRGREQIVALTEQLFRQGVAPRSQVDEARSALVSARRQAAAIRADIARFLDALAVLTGQAPGALDELADNAMPPPLPPAAVAIGDPAGLLARRPDIRAAERRLAATSARIGVARAAGLPSINFMGILGIGGTRLSDLSSLGDFTAIAAPVLQWNFLDFGRNEARLTQAEARMAGARAEYRQSVLVALREVEDGLVSFRYGRADLAEAAQLEALAASREDQARQRFEQGVQSRIELLAASLDRVEARANVVRARAALTRAFIEVETALGLGWRDPGEYLPGDEPGTRSARD